MRCIVVDDDDVTRMTISKCVERHPGLEFISDFSSATDALGSLGETTPDVIFLDVEMPDMTGLEFISAAKTDAHIVIISSKSEYAVDAFDFNVSDFIKKPVSFDRFCKSIDKINEMESGVKVTPEEVSNLFIKADSKFVKVTLDEILYIEALSDYVSINTEKGRFVLLGTMKNMASKLSEDAFVRIHRSYIVNLNRIELIQDGYVQIGEKHLPISRGSKDNLMSKINLLN